MTQRSETILAVVLSIILVPPMFVGLMMLIGMTIDGIGQRNEEHDRCLKRATNGYEIKQCR